MATRFYPDPSTSPDVSPGFSAVWDANPSFRRVLATDTPGNNGSNPRSKYESSGSPYYAGIMQFVSEPLESISAVLSVCKGAFLCYESAARANAFLHVIFRKCDQDGSNDADIASITDNTEADDDGYVNRFFGSSDLANQVFNQGDRLIIEVGFYCDNTKSDQYEVGFYTTDNHATTDLPENDTETTAYNSWIETGDTFTVASGDPPAAIKLGPMFAFA